MFSRERSISVRIIATLVFVATIILIIYSIATAFVYYSIEMSKLKSRAKMKNTQLQASIAGALWFYDKPQIYKILESIMTDKEVIGCVVDSGVRNYSIKRKNQTDYVHESPLPLSNDGIIMDKTIIKYGEEQLGTIQLFITNKFLKKELVNSFYYFAVNILILDLFLVIALYFIFSKIVISPLKKLKRYSLSITSGNIDDTSISGYNFYGEMEVLRVSLEKMLTQIQMRYNDIKDEVKKFKDSEERFRILVNTIPELIWLKDIEGNYLSCNKTFENFVGISQEEIIGKSNYDIVSKDIADTFKEYDLKVLKEQEPFFTEEKVENLQNPGEYRTLEITKVPMFDFDKKIIGILSIAKDITSKKEAEEEHGKLMEQLNQMQKIESVGRLAGGVAHDFNNMLGVIIGHAEIAIDQIEESDPVHEDIKEIIKAAERSADVTKQLLAFARKQAIKPKIIDLNDSIAGMFKMLKRFIGEDIFLELRNEEKLWSVKIDSSQLDQILANLCVNARDAISGSGKITIETANIKIDKSYVDYNAEALEGDFVMLSVSDTGCGISKDVLQHVFEPFFTTKDKTKGTGLGLATVYGIIKQNHGFINVYTEPGVGTVFRVYLPRYRGDEAGSLYIKKAKVEIAKGTETILLVEDEAPMLDIVKKILEKQGYNVIPVLLPEQAIETVKNYEGTIDLIITDVIMPGMNGPEMIAVINNIIPGIKHLFMSGYTSDVIAHHGVLNKGVELIQKPFSSNDMAIKVRKLLEEDE